MLKLGTIPKTALKSICKSKLCVNSAHLVEQTFDYCFWSSVDKSIGYGPNGDCWLWTASTNGKYGKIQFKNKLEFAHRVSYEIHNGQFDKSLFVLHSCDTPLCLNPKHLFLGTQQDNHKDMCSKNREFIPIPGHKTHFLSPEDVLEIFNAKFLRKTRKELATRFNINVATISDIWNGKTHNKITNGLTKV